MDRREYIRAMTQTILLELANRNATSRSAELPPWLIEGFTEQLFASSEMKIVLPPPRKNVNGLMLTFAGTNGPMQNPLQPARELLRAHPMLTFEDLSWPRDELFNNNSRASILPGAGSTPRAESAASLSLGGASVPASQYGSSVLAPADTTASLVLGGASIPASQFDAEASVLPGAGSTPRADNTADRTEVYRRSAQLFVTELLKRDGRAGRAATGYSGESDDRPARPATGFSGDTDGKACMRAMLDKLPQYYNWQFAFLDAFSFRRPLEVEKWWSLHLIHFTQREVAQYWPVDESWQKLDEALRPAVQIRAGTNEMPLRSDVPLQTIVRELDTPRQNQALKTELNELEALRYRLAPPFVGIADNYHQTIQTYLGEQNKGGFLRGKKNIRKRALEAVLRELDALDAKRATLRPHDEPVAQFTPSPAPEKP
jgi:hypothetical protein